jgi:hypothetical protein
MTGDKKLSGCESASSLLRPGKCLGEAKYAWRSKSPLAYLEFTQIAGSRHDDPICQLTVRHAYYDVALGRGDTFTWPGDMGHG